jgi:hypothetical protein
MVLNGIKNLSSGGFVQIKNILFISSSNTKWESVLECLSNNEIFSFQVLAVQLFF